MGAFKFRGAYNALSRLPASRQAKGVVAFSSGNHAQAVALAGRLLGIPATIALKKSEEICRGFPAFGAAKPRGRWLALDSRLRGNDRN